MPLALEQFRISMKNGGSELLSDVQKCKKCNIQLQETITGNRPTPNGNYCSDCYFDAIGEGFDKNPIFMPNTLLPW